MKAVVKIVFFLGLLHLGAIINPLPHAAAVSLHHAKVGFSIDSVARVDSAASLGINVAINYGTPFTPSDPVGAEMQARGMREVDAGIASDMFYYECHRTHTVAPPPQGTPNYYCATDVFPAMNSESAVLAQVDTQLKADAANPLIVGYWVVDDWVLWDAGSARTVLQDIHTHIRQYTPHNPAICGFGVFVDRPGVNSWDSRIGLNYSNAGCDMVGIYSYAAMSSTASNGSQLDYSMSAPLAAVFQMLKSLGWNSTATPLLGVGQAYAGAYAGIGYEPGLTSQQMLTQATAFCKAGATSVAWYGWDDTAFGSQSLTPATSAGIQAGIVSGIAACQSMWGVRDPRHPTRIHD